MILNSDEICFDQMIAYSLVSRANVSIFRRLVYREVSVANCSRKWIAIEIIGKDLRLVLDVSDFIKWSASSKLLNEVIVADV